MSHRDTAAVGAGWMLDQDPERVLRMAAALKMPGILVPTLNISVVGRYPHVMESFLVTVAT